MNNGNKSRYLGKAAELRVSSELLLRGINVYFPAMDDNSVDLLTSLGDKIQVKASRKEHVDTRGYRYPVYLFNTRRKKYVNSNNVTLRPKLDPSGIDFLICWCVDHDWFYIIPSAAITKTTVNIPIEPERVSKYQQYLNAWSLLEGGD
jgi:hypothetical protein